MSGNEAGPNVDWPDAIEGYTEDEILHHAHLMQQGGLIDAFDTPDQDNRLPMALPVSITWADRSDETPRAFLTVLVPLMLSAREGLSTQAPPS
jgi:hypothetical protein